MPINEQLQDQQIDLIEDLIDLSDAAIVFHADGGFSLLSPPDAADPDKELPLHVFLATETIFQLTADSQAFDHYLTERVKARTEADGQ